MLLSMTGFGEARTHHDDVTYVSEVKAVNNRYLKTFVRFPERYAPLEYRVDPLVRSFIDRGTVNVTLKVVHENGSTGTTINKPLLQRYILELAEVLDSVRRTKKAFPPLSLGDYLRLPGVLQDNVLTENKEFLERAWESISANLSLAFQSFQIMRQCEGKAMEADMLANIDRLSDLIEQIAQDAPLVVESYRRRLTETVARLMKEHHLPLNPSDLIREVVVFADRSDIAEEITRFRSHLIQFRSTVAGDESCGKKLDFLIQEMFREVNTIGSKSNDTNITNNVVNMKGTIERIREMVQNVQ